jgi:hypothetical protein
MATYMGCSSNCFVLALVIIDALLYKRGSDVRYLLVPSSMHRLVLGSVVVAIKFLEDSFRSNRFYAKVGGVDVGEFNRIESLLVFELDYELLSIASHFRRYSDRLHYLVSSSAAARAAQPDARPTWHIDLRTFFSFSERRLLRAGSSSDLVSRIRNQRMAGTATALAALAAGGTRTSSQSSVAALVGSPKPRHTSLRAASTNTASTIAAPRSSSPTAYNALVHTTSLPVGASATPLKTASASPKSSHKPLRASSGHAASSGSAAGAVPVMAVVVAGAGEMGAAVAAADALAAPAPKRTSPVALVRTSQSPPSELDRAAKLKRVQSTELTIDVFRTRAAPPARRISSSPAQLGPNGGRVPLARSQLAMVSTVVSSASVPRAKHALRRHQSLDDVSRAPARQTNSSPTLRMLSTRSISSHGSDTP